ncbi:CheY-like receiver protein [Candidatus Terasakiella magnetica]|nr:CheY-like receiver protein [Candidatus Terasakiella magnetica]
MTLNLSFFGKSCLVIAEAGNLRQLIVTVLHQIGLPNVTKADDIEAAIYELSQSAYDVVIFAEAEFAGSVEVVARIRRDCRGPAAAVPIIYLTGNMDPAHLSLILNSGANSVMTLPIGTRSLLKNLNRAMTDSREFIAHHNYRGPCRRGKNRNAKYSGPRRRAADRQHSNPPSCSSVPREVQSPPVIRDSGQRPVLPRAEENPSLSAREATIINGVNKIAASIERLRQDMQSTDDTSTRRQLREGLHEAVHRLVNLLTLADLSSPQDGQNENILRKKLDAIKGTFLKVLADIAQNRLEIVSSDIDRIIKGNEFPLGCSETLSERLAAVEEIVMVMGGARKLGDGMKQSLGRAWTDVLRIQEAEGNFTLVELTQGKKGSATKSLGKSRFMDDELQVAASQAEVMRSLKENG